MLHIENEHTAALLLNNIILVDDDDLLEYVKSNFRNSIKYVLLFANVGKSALGEVFISGPGNPGCHWTLLYADLTTNKWLYCDTNCWGIPHNLKTTVEPIKDEQQLHNKLNIRRTRKKSEPQIGFEPTTLHDLVGSSNHWATGDYGEQGSIYGSRLEPHHVVTQPSNDWHT